MKLSSLVEKEIGRLIGPDCEFALLSTDTRSIKNGELFVALKGDNFDAHDMIEVANEYGACALVVERELETSLPQLIVDNTTHALGDISAEYRKAFNGKVIAITGSSGKTTVKGMLESICSEAGNCLATHGNFNNYIGVPLTLARLNNSFDYAVIEAGTSNAGEIQYLTGLIQPHVAIITNVQPAHISGFGSLRAVAVEKTAIYGGDKGKSIAIVNLDDENIRAFDSQLDSRQVIGFTIQDRVPDTSGLALNGSVYVSRSSVDDMGRASFLANIDDQELEVSLAVLGTHNVANALSAIAAAKAVGIELADIKRGLECFTGAPGRMQVSTGINGMTLVNDTYNANPGSVKAAIDFLGGFDQSVLVCGDMGELGNDSESFHKEIGRYAKSKKVKKVFTVGKTSIDISNSFGDGEHFSSKAALIEALLPLMNNKSIVLVKGSRSSTMETVVHALSAEGER